MDKYIIVVYKHTTGLVQTRAYEQVAMTPEDAVMQQGEALSEIERS